MEGGSELAGAPGALHVNRAGVEPDRQSVRFNPKIFGPKGRFVDPAG
jgi:hypothetical protein